MTEGSWLAEPDERLTRFYSRVFALALTLFMAGLSMLGVVGLFYLLALANNSQVPSWVAPVLLPCGGVMVAASIVLCIVFSRKAGKGVPGGMKAVNDAIRKSKLERTSQATMVSYDRAFAERLPKERKRFIWMSAVAVVLSAVPWLLRVAIAFLVHPSLPFYRVTGLIQMACLGVGIILLSVASWRFGRFVGMPGIYYLGGLMLGMLTSVVYLGLIGWPVLIYIEARTKVQEMKKDADLGANSDDSDDWAYEFVHGRKRRADLGDDPWKNPWAEEGKSGDSTG